MTQKWLSAGMPSGASFSISSMRKLIVLIITSVLATGAVANADTVNVVNDPSKFIKIVGFKAADGGSLSSLGMDPYAPGGNANYQRLEVVVDDPDNQLTQVSACIYDADVITNPDETNCGTGFEDPHTYNTVGGSAPSRSAATGAYRPESLIQMSFLPGLNGLSNDSDTSVNAVLPETSSTNPFNHVVTQKKAYIGGNGSWVNERNFDNFTDVTASPKNAYWIGFHFGVLFAAKHGDNWKVRVVATYRDSEGVDSNIELIGTDTDKVRYFGAFTDIKTNPPENFPTQTKRDALTVNYGDVIQGESSTVQNIDTGSYITNSSSNIGLSANAFTGLAFSGNANPSSGEVSLGCEPQSANDLLAFFANPASGQSSSISLLNSVQANSNPGVGQDARDPLTAEAHKCTFIAGDSVAAGSYANTVTVGISKTPSS